MAAMDTMVTESIFLDASLNSLENSALIMSPDLPRITEDKNTDPVNKPMTAQVVAPIFNSNRGLHLFHFALSPALHSAGASRLMIHILTSHHLKS